MPDIVDILLALSRVLNGLRVMLNRLMPAFHPLEVTVLREIERCVGEEFLSLYREHIGAVNYVQRDGGNRRVRMYKWVFPGRYDWNRPAFFEPEQGVSKLARFKIRLGDGKEFGGSLESIDGVIRNLTFGQDVSAIKKRTDVVVTVTGGPICTK